ncbi:hypothetical protein PoB_005864200 [Plakobranchus ocellatus]|uniref:Endonuclease/exonuclease/phosphatase domain-containing protein n=1 Tax=Plakobranchus ocellatus TaxID=259542 RepID=A0AAV4CKP7_9GAST|nr:hypothetical protein PoB_005864200 [Plakobranchus ocellatus]
MHLVGCRPMLDSHSHSKGQTKVDQIDGSPCFTCEYHQVGYGPCSLPQRNPHQTTGGISASPRLARAGNLRLPATADKFIVVCDFNSHSLSWGYPAVTPEGKKWKNKPSDGCESYLGPGFYSKIWKMASTRT